MTLRDILRVKGSAVHTIDPSASLEDVVRQLVERNCGSLVVCGAGADCQGQADLVQGIITERDILRALAARRGSLAELKVGETMTRELITGALGDSVEHTMGVMTEHRIRHLPILEDGRLAGIISIGDVVKAQHDQMVVENHYLKSYIQG